MGGNKNMQMGSYSFIGAGFGNSVVSYSIIAGGLENVNDESLWSTIGGGYGNTVTGSSYQGILGGEQNTNEGNSASLLGGTQNSVAGAYGSILGGSNNLLDEYGYASVVAGGDSNSASSYYSFALGHDAFATSYNSAVFGFGKDSCYAMGPNTINVCTDDGGMFSNGEPVGSNPIDKSNNWFDDYSNVGGKLDYAAVSGGYSNTANAEYSTIGGGRINRAQGLYAFVGGGYANKVFSNYGSIGGGFKNVVSGRFASILGGSRNTVTGRFSVAAGYATLANNDYTATFGFDPSTQCIPTGPNEIAFCCDLFTINGADVFDMSRRQLEVAESLHKQNDEHAKVLDSMIAEAHEHEKSLAETDKQLANLHAVADRLLKLASDK